MKQFLVFCGTPVVLEVEMPTDEMSKRRIGFYERLGFELDNQVYHQPPYAQRNHIWVTAEGIETREQAAQLEKLGCNFLQGYLISRPLPAQECVSFIRQWEDTDILGQPGQEDDDCRNHMKQLKEENEEFCNCLNII